MNDIGKLPKAQDDWAFFLDVDGTLVGIAETPAAVVVDPQIVAILQGLVRRFACAVALVSGRSLRDIDRLFAPLLLPAAGLHGMERRTAAGSIVRTAAASAAVATARTALQELPGQMPGVLLEDKGAALAVHYRQAPEREADVLAAARDAVAHSAGRLELLVGKKVAELRQPGPNKGDVVAQFMAEAPFAGRTPVFIGDDVTDEDGFRAVNRLGGHSIRIGAAGVSAARYHVSDVAGLRVWLLRTAMGAADA